MKRTTILVTLFSPDATTSGTLNDLAKSIQAGFDTVTNLPLPEVHCLYCRQGTAYQYQLMQCTTTGLPDPAHQIPLLPVEDQMRTFFECGPVSKAVSNGAPVYLIVGAHGRPPGPSVGGIINQLFGLLLSLFSFLWRPSNYWRRLFETWRNLFRTRLPVGAAFGAGTASNPQFLSLTAFNRLLTAAFNEPVNALVLHSCSLSSIETIHTLNNAEQQIACESELKSHMTLCAWIPIAARGDFLVPLSNVVPPAEGIFSSHLLSKNGTDEIIKHLNQLGDELRRLLPKLLERIEFVREDSSVNGSDLVDLFDLCTRLAGIFSSPVLASLQGAICAIQLDHHVPQSFGTSEERGFHGISVFFPSRNTTAEISNLPHAFQRDADDWVTFLKAWLP